jgi:hypothetical protein
LFVVVVPSRSIVAYVQRLMIWLLNRKHRI